MNEEQLRLHLAEEDPNDDKAILDKLEVLVHMLHKVRSTRGDVDQRGISIVITHIETARLWFKDAVKTVD